MSDNENGKESVLQGILKRVDAAIKLAANGYHAQATDERMMRSVAPLLGLLARPEVRDTIHCVVQDAAAQMMDEATFNPCEAAKPAHHLLQALEDIRRGGVELQQWAKDDRFKWRPSELVGFGLERRVPPAEVIERVAYLAGLLGMAARQADLAANIVLRLRDPRAQIVPDHTPTALPTISAPGTLIALPTYRFPSEGEKVRQLHMHMALLGNFLVRAAERGETRLRQASIGDQAFSPGVVAAEAVAISIIVTNGLLTCAALATLACQRTSNSATYVAEIEMPQDSLPDA